VKAVTSSSDELTGDFGGGFEAISISDSGLFCRLLRKIVQRILGLLQQYWPVAIDIAAQANVGFSNWPFRVKRFQTIHRYSVDVAHGLVLLFGNGTRALVWGFFSQEV
jgi:hypothetical protein